MVASSTDFSVPSRASDGGVAVSTSSSGRRRSRSLSSSLLARSRTVTSTREISFCYPPTSPLPVGLHLEPSLRILTFGSKVRCVATSPPPLAALPGGDSRVASLTPNLNSISADSLLQKLDSKGIEKSISPCRSLAPRSAAMKALAGRRNIIGTRKVSTGLPKISETRITSGRERGKVPPRRVPRAPFAIPPERKQPPKSNQNPDFRRTRPRARRTQSPRGRSGRRNPSRSRRRASRWSARALARQRGCRCRSRQSRCLSAGPKVSWCRPVTRSRTTHRNPRATGRDRKRSS